MSGRDGFALGSGFGALFVVACYHLACRFAGKHFLAIVNKETP
jgi:hypothetical protein